jgi:hypothetical protein
MANVEPIPVSRADHLTATARLAARKARAARADERSASLLRCLKQCRQSGYDDHDGIAEALNKRGIPTPSRHGHWYTVQVARVLARLLG